MTTKNISSEFDKVSSFNTVKNMAENAKIHLSFGGCYYFTVKGYNGYISGADAFLIKVMELVKKTNYEFDENQRDAGWEISKKIDQFYENQNTIYKNSCLLTKILSVIREIFNDRTNSRSEYCSLKLFPNYVDKNLRWPWLDFFDSMLFALYTPNQYRKVFKKAPPHDAHTVTSPNRWYPPYMQ
jgi:hypothetical protein